MEPKVTVTSNGFLMLHNVSDQGTILRNVSPSKVIRHPQTGTEIVVAKHNMRTVAQLSRFGIHAPSPVLSEYDWPGRFAPFSHQRETVEFLTLHPKCFLLSDMGTGKTASMLWAADYLMKQGIIRRALVLAPLSCLNRVWADEIFQCLPHRTWTILHATRDKRKYLTNTAKTDFLILNHDGMGVIAEELVRRGDVDLIILDEASVYRNARTERFRTIRKVILATGARLWLATGTPTPQAPTDAWALARLVNPERTPTSFTRFREATMYKATAFKWRPRNCAKAVVRGVMQPAIRHRKEDCMDLPPVLRTQREVVLSKEQGKTFEQIRKQMIAESKGERITAINAATRLLKLLQICCGSVYTDEGNVADLDMTDRLTVLREVIDASAHKVIVYVPFRHAITRVQKELTRVNITNGVVHGGVAQKDRDLIIQRFQHAEDPKVLIAQPRTASHGLNLTCADTIVWFGPVFSAEAYQQANERMARPGQDKNMTIVHLGAHLVEWGAYKTVMDHNRRQQSILSLYENVLA